MNKIALVTKTCPEYLKDTLSKLRKFDTLKVNGLNAGQLYKIEKENPDIFAEIAENIKNGKWYPAAGTWCGEQKNISDEQLRREILYSSRWLKEKFGTGFRVFCGKAVCSPAFSQNVYNGRFDCAILEDESENYWLDGEDRFRLFIMSNVDTVDIKDVDEAFINKNSFETYEELLHNTLSSPLDLKSVKRENTEEVLNKAEKDIILAEKVSAQAGKDKSEEIRECWFDIFEGKLEAACEKAKKIAEGKDFRNTVKISSDDVKLSVFKSAEDKSGDTVIRITETAGTGKCISVICDEIDAGFRCEIEPYETTTYRIDKNGFVRETFIYE